MQKSLMQQLSVFVLFTFMYYWYKILVNYVYFLTFEVRIMRVNENSLVKYYEHTL